MYDLERIQFHRSHKLLFHRSQGKQKRKWWCAPCQRVRSCHWLSLPHVGSRSIHTLWTCLQELEGGNRSLVLPFQQKEETHGENQKGFRHSFLLLGWIVSFSCAFCWHEFSIQCWKLQCNHTSHICLHFSASQSGFQGLSKILTMNQLWPEDFWPAHEDNCQQGQYCADSSKLRQTCRTCSRQNICKVWGVWGNRSFCSPLLCKFISHASCNSVHQICKIQFGSVCTQAGHHPAPELHLTTQWTWTDLSFSEVFWNMKTDIEMFLPHCSKAKAQSNHHHEKAHVQTFPKMW